eukprot:TRINITY_DN3312_c0_g1_i6.p1 TRINITY_DN3312_c0_g1~~TRINITY_DN3312_c0_g1_i6.p1  ORF type:complete len:225 (-),score=29.21 TRINITY_DN3312_c0_g1_i6:634-1308(-)
MTGNLPIYFMSILKCPISITNRIEKLQRAFRWHGKSAEKKFHLRDWVSVCTSKLEGGLGIRSLRKMNQALLGKWLWRLGDESEGQWRLVVLEKYGNQKDGWEVQVAAYKYSAIWKGIISSSEKFMQNIRCNVCLGKKILFWKDTWIGEEPLASKFPDLFNCARDKQANVENYMDRSGMSGQITWSPTFRRNLKENEELQFLSLIDLLRDIHLSEDMEDTRIWKV